jgi:hypothetical protein
MPRVIHFSRLRALPDTWQILAEHPCQMVNISAQPAHRCASGRWPGFGNGRSAVQVTPVSVRPGRVGGGADAPRGGADHERETAGGRVSGKRDPRRHGQGDRGPNCQEPDRCRQEDEPSKHFAQPPRENYSQDARYAWQECGRVLVKVRRSIETFTVIDAPLTCESPVVSAFGGACGCAQPRVAICGRSGRCMNNYMKRNKFRISSSGGTGKSLWPHRSEGRDFCRGAAIWRNLDRLILAVVPVLDKDCLSFVMPQKQGSAAAGHGDTR